MSQIKNIMRYRSSSLLRRVQLPPKKPNLCSLLTFHIVTRNKLQELKTTTVHTLSFSCDDATLLPWRCCCEETCRKRSGIWKRKSKILRADAKHEQPNRDCLVDSTSAIVTLSELVFIFRLAKSITILPGHFDVMPAIIVILYSSIVFFSLFLL